MIVFHTSPSMIFKIEKYGLSPFGDCLFFSESPYFMTQADNPVIYQIGLNSWIDVRDLYHEEIIDDIAQAFDVDFEIAADMLCSEIEVEGENGWYIQRKQGECAELMGYESCKARDEQGTVYIVPMFGRESDLILVGEEI